MGKDLMIVTNDDYEKSIELMDDYGSCVDHVSRRLKYYQDDVECLNADQIKDRIEKNFE